MKRKVDNVKVVCEELQKSKKKKNKKWKSRKNRKMKSEK